MTGINVAELEQSVINQDYNHAIELLTQLLADLDKGYDYVTDIKIDGQDPNLISIYTQIAFCISKLLLTEDYDLDTQRYHLLILFQHVIANVFLVSGYGSSNFIIQHLQARLQQAKATIAEYTTTHYQTVVRLLLACSIFSLSHLDEPIDFEQYLQIIPDISLAAFIPLFAAPMILDPDALDLQKKLLNTAKLLSDLHPSKMHLSYIASGWLLCSYHAHPQKHLLKTYFNQLLKNWLAANDIAHPSIKIASTPRKKPVMVICVEAMHTQHAMYRCYSEALKRLQDNFITVCVYDEKNVDESSLSLFTQHISYHSETLYRRHSYETIQYLINRIQKIAPDVVYYPSLGLAAMPIALANLRLAPIQALSMGHPASSFCDTIDYALLFEEQYHQACDNLFSETIITYPFETLNFLPNATITEFTPHIRNKPKQLNIIICERAQKLNPNFLDALKVIQQFSKRPIRFHFFTNTIGLLYEATKQGIHQYLPGTAVYPKLPLTHYLKLCRESDIALATFPFGSINCAIDFAAFGIPIITLEGHEIHSRSESFILRYLNMPTWLIAHNEETFVNVATRLIDDDNLRVEISHQFAQNYRQHFQHLRHHPENLCELFQLLIAKHEKISKQPIKAYSLPTLRKL